MIDFSDARAELFRNALSLPNEEIQVGHALGRILASDYYAPMNLPPFDNSAVDGFAFNYSDTDGHIRIKISDTVRAVSQSPIILPKNSCIAIMTGAPMPLGSDTVIMKEYAHREGEYMMPQQKPHCGQYLRLAGSDVKKHSLVAHKGTLLTPALMGILLGLGITRIKVFCQPSIAIISTGDELVEPTKTLKYGQVYYFLGPMLKAQCESLGFTNVQVLKVGDDQHQIESAFRGVLSADLVLITGGMSMGEHDLVRPALTRCGVEKIFWQGSWRPGKPLFFGCKDNTRIFGMPGNPVASFVGFRIFVQSFLGYSLGTDFSNIRCASLAHDYYKKAGWTLFLRAKVDEKNNLSIFEEQESHHMFTLTKSNALCVIEAPTTIVKAGAPVHYYAL